MNWQEKLIRSVGRAYQKHSCPEISEADEYEHGKFWLSIHNPKSEHPGSVMTDSTLTVGEISAIFADRQQSKLIKQQKENAEENLEFLLGKLRAAQAEIYGSDAGRSAAQKYADALGILGLIFKANDPDKKIKERESKIAHLNRIYRDYRILRLGGLTFLSSIDQLVMVKRHSHQRAFGIIQDSYRLTEWEHLVQQFRRYKIKYSKNPKPYPEAVENGRFNQPTAEFYSGTVLPDKFEEVLKHIPEI